MSGRRRHDRYGVMNAVGILRVLREVTVQRGVDNEFVAISDTPAAIGELLALERIVNGTHVTVQVCVIDSRPAVVGRSLRHRLQLKPCDEITHEAKRIRRPKPAKSRDR